MLERKRGYGQEIAIFPPLEMKPLHTFQVNDRAVESWNHALITIASILFLKNKLHKRVRCDKTEKRPLYNKATYIVRTWCDMIWLHYTYIDLFAVFSKYSKKDMMNKNIQDETWNFAINQFKKKISKNWNKPLIDWWCLQNKHTKNLLKSTRLSLLFTF